MSDSTEAFPFQRGRTVVFTNAKLMERRDMGSGAQADDSSQSPSYSLLPTQYLALHLDTASNALDRVFAKQSIGLARLDQFVGMQDPAILQQLVVRVKVGSYTFVVPPDMTAVVFTLPHGLSIDAR